MFVVTIIAGILAFLLLIFLFMALFKSDTSK